MSKRRHRHQQHCSRREFLSAALAAPILAPHSGLHFQKAAASREGVRVASPNGRIEFQLFVREGRLSYQISFKGRPVIETSPIAILIDDTDLGRNVEIGRTSRHRLDERYSWRGNHSEAVNRCNGAAMSIRQSADPIAYTLEVRAFDDGIAFRYVVPGDANPRVPDEATVFVIPSGSSVWSHDFEGHYEGIHARKEISEVQAGEWAAPPLTIRLPDSAGYASITEAALVDYSGMGLEADGQRGFRVRLGHALPVSYPFRLRYGVEEGTRLSKPAALARTITSPWRVVMIGADLDALVNCDIVHNVSPAPDKKLFPKGMHTDWIRPGRSVWKYLDGGANTLEEMKEFSRMAGLLGFEYNLIEGFWQRWSDQQLRELVDYAAQQKVRIWLWKHSRDIRDAQARRGFFKKCQDFGIAGVKLDFFDHEAKEVIDLYHAALRDAAEFRLMVDFHGANKPAGEARTWPNEMTREGIRGLEYRRTESWAQHNTTLPFTRMLAGHADYTPVIFGERRRETSWAHQIATAAIFTSPVLVYGAHPKSMLENPGAEMIKSIPSVWDETIALPVCAIGEIAAFARRRGKRWFVAILNGPAARTVPIPLSFLGKGPYQALVVRDVAEEAAAAKVESRPASRDQSITVDLRAGGGFIGRFTPE